MSTKITIFDIIQYRDPVHSPYPTLFELFEKHCMYEHCIENLKCIISIHIFKKKPTLNAAQKIFDKFLKKTSEFEININQEQIENIKNIIKKDKIIDTIFDNILYEMIWILKDSFDRFKRTNDFIKLTEKKENLIQDEDIKIDIKRRASIYDLINNIKTTRTTKKKYTKKNEAIDINFSIDDNFKF
jgi:hypothetical protein